MSKITALKANKDRVCFRYKRRIDYYACKIHQTDDYDGCPEQCPYLERRPGPRPTKQRK